jgi:hypothetical protein
MLCDLCTVILLWYQISDDCLNVILCSSRNPRLSCLEDCLNGFTSIESVKIFILFSGFPFALD